MTAASRYVRRRSLSNVVPSGSKLLNRRLSRVVLLRRLGDGVAVLGELAVNAVGKGHPRAGPTRLAMYVFEKGCTSVADLSDAAISVFVPVVAECVVGKAYVFKRFRAFGV